MKIQHKFGAHNKIVKGPHNYSPGGQAGGAQLPMAGAGGAPGGGMDASGGSAAGYADGGSIYDSAVDKVSRLMGADDYDPNKGRKPVTPLAAGGDEEKYVGKSGAEATKATLDEADRQS
jgi:hypothetical protein